MVEYKTRKEVFRRGYGVYECRMCHKKTRGNEDSMQVELCGKCYEEATLENELNDGTITQEQYDRKIASVKERYNGRI